MKTGFWTVVGCVCVLTGCSGPASPESASEPGSSIQLNLSTLGQSGTEYRLGPATFDVTGGYNGQQWTLSATGAEPALHLALDPGYYHVSLKSDWQLSRIENGQPVPIAATLLTGTERDVSVTQFTTTPVTYAFHLGESGIDIGVSVDEGIPEGYDGRLLPSGDSGYFYIELRNGSGYCCVQSLAEAQGVYPGLNLFPPQG
jgi:hypothetical protein